MNKFLITSSQWNCSVYSVSMSKTNTNANKFGLTRKDKFKYKYIEDEKKVNTNTNMNIWTDICKFKYENKYLSHGTDLTIQFMALCLY